MIFIEISNEKIKRLIIASVLKISHPDTKIQIMFIVPYMPIKFYNSKTGKKFL